MQGALLWGERWNVDFQDDLESPALCSVHEFIFLRLNQWVILKTSEMIMVKKLW